MGNNSFLKFIFRWSRFPVYRGSVLGRFYCITCEGKGKAKVHPRTGHDGPEEEWQRYSFTLSLTSALDGGGWSMPRPSHFTPRKETRYPLHRRLGGPQGRSGLVRKISPPPRFDPRTFQLVASCYTDWAIPAPWYHMYQQKQECHPSFITGSWHVHGRGKRSHAWNHHAL